MEPRRASAAAIALDERPLAFDEVQQRGRAGSRLAALSTGRGRR
jgi:hypothetical protein